MFKKQFFPDSIVRSIASDTDVFNEGKQLAESGAVRSIELNAKERQLTIQVADELTETVDISFLKNGIASTYSCTCVDFQKYSGACRHVISSMIELNQYTAEEIAFEGVEKKEREAEQTTAQKNEAVVDELLGQSFSPLSYLNKTRLKFEYILNIYQVYNAEVEATLYMRVGVDHLYVVNDFSEILNVLLQGEEHSFGRQLLYSPTTHELAPKDKKILERLNEILKVLSTYSSDYYHASYPNSPLPIPPPFLWEILQLLNQAENAQVRFGMRPRVQSELNQLRPLIVSGEQKLPFEMTIQKEESEYKVTYSPLEIDGPVRMLILMGTPIVVIDDVFYSVATDHMPLFIRLFNAYDELESDTLWLDDEGLSKFLTIYGPFLNENFQMHISSSLEKKFKREKLQPKLYIDWANSQLLITPVFQYGLVTLQPLAENIQQDDESDTDEIALRDLAEEKEVLNALTYVLPEVNVSDESFTLDNLDHVSYFLYDEVPQLDKKMPVYLSAAAEKLLYQTDGSSLIEIEHNPTTNLLDVNFQLQHIERQELPELIRQLHRDRRFYRLKNGQIIDLTDDSIHEVTDVIDMLGLTSEELSEEDLSVQLVRGIGAAGEAVVQRGQHFEELLQNLSHPENLEFSVPKSLNAQLRPYQVTGFKWLKTMDYYGFSAVLADDMGLGKTIQAITFILSKWEETQGKYLVVCPSSVMYNWELEFSRFAPQLKTRLITGSAEERQEALEEAMEDDEVSVIISSYPLIQRDVAAYKDFLFETTVLDESQNIKNVTTKTSKAIKQIKTKNMIALSGTPIENNLQELWALFSTVQPGLFRDKNQFNQLTAEEISKKINVFILRRLKEEVLSDLPPKTETVQYIELSPDQKRLYQAQLALIRQDMNHLLEQDTFEKNRMQILAGMTRLRQICNDPRLIDPEFEGDSAKFERLFEFLDESRENKKRIVIFSQFTKMLQLIRERLDRQQVSYHYLDGSTDKKDRLDLTTRFNEGEKELFLISLKAGGVGLNLTGGDTVILYDSWWNPAIEDQATDRVHRFGQKNPVQVLRLITKGTIEEGIYELQEQKRELIDSVIQSDAHQSIRGLSKDDILNLLGD